MDDRSSDFRDALVELIEGSPRPSEHPSPDRWIAYHRGELPPEEEALLQEHLARCPDCFDLAAGAAEFARPDEDPGAGQDVETTALWRLVRPQLDPPPANVREIRERAVVPRRPSRLPTTLAASFFVALIGMTAWNLQLQSDRKALRAPQANVPNVEVPIDERAPGERELTVPAKPLRLLFHTTQDLPLYHLAIRDAATSRERVAEELRPDRDLALNLYIPEGLLPPGRYRMELSDGRGRVLKEQLLRVTEADGGE